MSSENKIILKTDQISKTFDFKNYIIKDFTYSFESSNIYGIAGNNGAGKSTLIQLLSGLLSPTKGSIHIEYLGKKLTLDELRGTFGFCSPYLNIYEEFTPIELAKIYSELRSQNLNSDRLKNILNLYSLENKKDSAISSFSSGMKQRMKLILSLLFDDDLIFWDEPGSNLDKRGIDINLNLLEERKNKNKLSIIASNDITELNVCDYIIDINEIFSSN